MARTKRNSAAFVSDAAKLSLYVPHRAVKGNLTVDAALGRRELFRDIWYQLDADARSGGNDQETVIQFQTGGDHHAALDI